MDIIRKCQNCGKRFLCSKYKNNDGYCEEYKKTPRDSDIEMKEKLEKCKKLEEVTNGQFNFKDIY